MHKSKRIIPSQVLRTVVQNDTEALIHFGRNGAKKRILNLRAKKVVADHIASRRLEGYYQMALQANEDICPVD